MNFLKKNLNGILVCFVIAVPSWLRDPGRNADHISMDQ